jgi:hypothetical protein
MNTADMTAKMAAGQRLHRRARPVGRIDAQGAGRLWRRSRCLVDRRGNVRPDPPDAQPHHPRSKAFTWRQGDRRDPVRTHDGRQVDGKPTPQALIEKGVVPFIKIDKGLEDEANGVQLMKPMPELDALLDQVEGAGRLWHQGTFGHQLGQPRRHRRVVKQQFEVGKQVLATA